MSLSVLSVPWFLLLMMGAKGMRKERKRREERREREGKKEIKSVKREQFQVLLSGPNRAFSTVY